MRQVFSAWFMIAFLVLGAGMGAFSAVQAWRVTGGPGADTVFNGKWTAAYDRAFAEKIPVFDTARDLWGIVDYALFRQGRKGVVIGSDGWLFTDEEFTVWPGADKEIADHLSYVSDVKKKLDEKGVKLAIVLIPAKARLYPDRLGVNRWPARNISVYESALGTIRGAGIPVVDLYTVFSRAQNREALFLHTDTHWSPAGARLAARTAAETMAASWPEIIGKTGYMTETQGAEDHHGDLTRYVPLGPLADRIGPRPDRLDIVSTVEKDEGQGGSADSENALFGGEDIPVALVGTSYSANKKWNFDGYLKESLRADVLNAADEGRGPFITMENYLAGENFRNAPPKLVIWEIPERYLAMPRLNEEKKKEQ